MHRLRKEGLNHITQIPKIDIMEEYKRLCKLLLQLEPRFDERKYDPRILKSIVGWVWQNNSWNMLNLDYNKGLFLFGAIGRGKSLTMRLLYEYLKDVAKRYPEYYSKNSNRFGKDWKSASVIANLYANDGLPELGPMLKPYHPLYIDELGREPIPASNYGTRMNVMQFILQMRYDIRSYSITHVTTNLSLDEITEVYGVYIADRCLEMFNFIEFRGESLRR